MNIVFRTLFGSRLYGTALPDSDHDYKGIYLPTAEQILLGEGPYHVKLAAEDDVYTLKRYLELLAEGQAVALDMYFSPPAAWKQLDPIFYDVQKIGPKLINRNVAASVGYARAQASKYSVRGTRITALETVLDILRKHPKPGDQLQDALFAGGFAVATLPAELAEHVRVVGGEGLPAQTFLEVCGRKIALNCKVSLAIDCWGGLLAEYGERAREAADAKGADLKALYHAERIIGQTLELLLTGNITLPRPTPVANHLLQIRRGEIEPAAIFDSIERGFESIAAAQKDCNVLPTEPDTEAARELVMQIHREVLSA